ncbi:MAG: hypothetical protein BGP12_09075 [Rhodospirillales bacterium 70-18]|nr:hypothetical protein [Rhodospirillales bacterium]OJY66624.1 MAG: hypothetical protein BGP12_09075 [Rhodospirillales bacterium 70-18]
MQNDTITTYRYDEIIEMTEPASHDAANETAAVECLIVAPGLAAGHPWHTNVPRRPGWSRRGADLPAAVGTGRQG